MRDVLIATSGVVFFILRCVKERLITVRVHYPTGMRSHQCSEHDRCERPDGHTGPHAAGFPNNAARRPDSEPRAVWSSDE